MLKALIKLTDHKSSISGHDVLEAESFTFSLQQGNRNGLSRICRGPMGLMGGAGGRSYLVLVVTGRRGSLGWGFAHSVAGM